MIRAVETCPHPELPLEIRTDSQYTIMCLSDSPSAVCMGAPADGIHIGMTTYLPAWIKSGFKTAASHSKFSLSRQAPASLEPIKNADLIKHLLVLLRRREPGSGVRFKYVPAHRGNEGNEAADVGFLPSSLREDFELIWCLKKLARCGAMMPALADREDWLDPDAEDRAPELVVKPPTDVEVEVSDQNQFQLL